MFGLEPLELVQQPIELLVGDLRGVVDVVALFVVADLAARSCCDCGRRDPATTVRPVYRSREST